MQFQILHIFVDFVDLCMDSNKLLHVHRFKNLNPLLSIMDFIRITVTTHCFVERRSFKGIIILLAYVDDILISKDVLSGIVFLEQILHSSFHMKDLGHLMHFLVLEVTLTTTGIFLSQYRYTEDLIDMAKMIDAKTFDTLIELNIKYSKNSAELML